MCMSIFPLLIIGSLIFFTFGVRLKFWRSSKESKISTKEYIIYYYPHIAICLLLDKFHRHKTFCTASFKPMNFLKYCDILLLRMKCKIKFKNPSVNASTENLIYKCKQDKLPSCQHRYLICWHRDRRQDSYLVPYIYICLPSDQNCNPATSKSKKNAVCVLLIF